MFTGHTFRTRLAVAISLALVLVLGLVGTAAAVEIRGENNTTIGKDEVINDDLIVGGNTVLVEGTINGDLIAGGTSIIINGRVNGSVFVGGQTLTVNGQVAGSVYGGGASLTLGPDAAIGRNLYFGGYSLTTEPESTVGRDLLMGGYQALLGGEVERDVRAGLGALQLDGSVGGDVIVDVGEPDPDVPQFGPFFMAPGMPAMIAPGLRIGPDAQIGGQLQYTSAVEQANAISSAPEGGVVYQTPEPGERADPQPSPRVGFAFRLLDWFVARVRDFITLLLLGALVLWQRPTLLTTLMEKARAQTLPAAGWGLLVIVAGYAGAVVVGGLILALGVLFGLVTLGGLSQTIFGVGFSGLGLAFTVFTFLVSYGSKLVVAYLVSQVLVQRLTPQLAGNKPVLLGVGVVLYVIVRGIPLLGWLVGVAATLIGVGAMWLVLRESRARPAAPAAPAAPAPA